MPSDAGGAARAGQSTGFVEIHIKDYKVLAKDGITPTEEKETSTKWSAWHGPRRRALFLRVVSRTPRLYALSSRSTVAL